MQPGHGMTVLPVTEKIGDIRCKIDPTLYYWREGEELIGVLWPHVDNFFYGGTEKFQKR